MRFWNIVGLSLIVTGCAVAPAPLTTAERDTVFSDALFKRPSQRISAEDVFALSPEMQEYLRNDVARVVRTKGSQHGLFDALYDKGLLKLEYDAAMTRNASQAFAARAGNCLSLVIMTAAFAKEMGMPVRYQNVFVDETWSRNGEFYLSIGHVNLSLGHRLVEYGPTESAMTIDFLPPANIKGLRTWVIDEATIVAMYMNNRAVEALTVGNVDDAYWYAREAITQDRRFLTAFNTLGVVYQKHGNLPQSQRAFEYVLEREPGNTRSMSNLAAVLFASGNTVAAEALTRKLAQIEPNPPFAYFKRGVAAMEKGDYKLAQQMFSKEVDRAAYYHEFQFWLALAYLGLGDTENARAHLAIAEENSTTRDDRDLYAAKLAHLNGHPPIVREKLFFNRSPR
ncbi:MAG TPA: tetratricopeptide repeat protein [Casimicrobiaceae bacterium]|nr:tetratricopeptide repeat protein [Casimicrobiaceae bacterium]